MIESKAYSRGLLLGGTPKKRRIMADRLRVIAGRKGPLPAAHPPHPHVDKYVEKPPCVTRRLRVFADPPRHVEYLSSRLFMQIKHLQDDHSIVTAMSRRRALFGEAVEFRTRANWGFPRE